MFPRSQVDFWTMPFPSLFPRDASESAVPSTASSPIPTTSTPMESPLPSPPISGATPNFNPQSPVPSSPQVAPPDQKLSGASEKVPPEGTEIAVAEVVVEGKKKRNTKRKKEEGGAEPKPKKPRKKQEEGVEKAPPLPQEDKKKKPAAKRRKKKQPEEAVTESTTNVSTGGASTAAVTINNAPTIVPVTITNPQMSMDQPFLDPWSKMDFGDGEMEDLGGEIDLDSWANSYTTVALPPNANMIRDATPPRSELASSGNLFNSFSPFALPTALTPASTSNSSSSTNPTPIPIPTPTLNPNPTPTPPPPTTILTHSTSKTNSLLNGSDTPSYSSTPLNDIMLDTPTLQVCLRAY